METEKNMWHRDTVFHSCHMNHSEYVVYKKAHFHGGCKNYHDYQDIVRSAESKKQTNQDILCSLKTDSWPDQSGHYFSISSFRNIIVGEF